MKLNQINKYEIMKYKNYGTYPCTTEAGNIKFYRKPTSNSTAI